uniref:Uncharacterized protein n=1 Tax=Meloidogyne enterolobii TaxID=390850 RepID=A0A6V7WS32_MELEN|nr:unnamed protein product [Meloidogyne enterolobii]
MISNFTENSMFCAVKNKNKIINKCCPGLTCATKADGRSFCTMGTCANTAGADCDPGENIAALD